MLVGTHIQKIAEIEGFQVEIFKNGKLLSNHETEPDLKVFSREYSNRAKDSFTVQEWITNRFNKVNQGFTVNVLKGDGSTAPGNTKLSTVRQSYE